VGTLKLVAQDIHQAGRGLARSHGSIRGRNVALGHFDPRPPKADAPTFRLPGSGDERVLGGLHFKGRLQPVEVGVFLAVPAGNGSLGTLDPIPHPVSGATFIILTTSETVGQGCRRTFIA